MLFKCIYFKPQVSFFFFKVNFLRDCNGCFYKRIANSEEVRELVHGLGKVEQLGIVR